jgi:hypothetical protein
MKKYTIFYNDGLISVCTQSLQDAIKRFGELRIQVSEDIITESEYKSYGR